jgi:transposase, IS5 family
MKEAYEGLIRVTRQSVAQAQRVRAALGGAEDPRVKRLCQALDTFVPRVEQVIQQAERRVLLGETVPAPEKLVSLFGAPHTDREAGEGGADGRVRAQGDAGRSGGRDH